jgi:DNA-binding CsgD family transcriptional regulator
MSDSPDPFRPVAGQEAKAMSFETHVYPTIERYARKVLGNNPELISTATVLGWYYWSQGPQELPASVWARVAVRAVRAGRDLPGVRDSGRDALDGATQGGGMGELADRRPGPLRMAIAREEYARLVAGLSPRQRLMVDAVAGGAARTDRLAAELGVTPGRVSQMRREIMAKLKQ